MGKKISMLVAGALAAAAAHAAPATTVLQDLDCRLVKADDIAGIVAKVGKDTGLRLPKDMAVRAEVHCTPDGNGKRHVYTIRTTIEKLVTDGEQQRWAMVAHNTSYGTTSGSAALLKEVRFAVRDVIRQEP